MAVFQPLYFGGGQYTPDLDRKLISSVVGVDSSGNRLFGVIPEDNVSGVISSLAASIVSSKMSVAAGMCIVSDDSTENSTSGGYVAGIISGTTETYTPATNSTGSVVTDFLYGVVDPTQYVITAKQQTASTTVRITTSSNHGFVEGRTVIISGLGALYDGAYTLGVGSIISTTVFAVTTNSSITTDASAVTISATAYKGTTAKIITAKALESGVARITATAHGFSNDDTVTIVGVDSTFDGTYRIQNVQTDTFDYVINKNIANVASYASPTSVSVSSIARASTPFYIAAERTGGTTLSTKSKVLLATYQVGIGLSVPTAGSVVDKRKFVSSLGGTVLYTTAGGSPSSTPGRIRYNVTTNVLEHYNGTAWIAPIELESSTSGSDANKAARGDHVHSGFSSTTHTHAYEPYTHTHTLSEVTDYSAGANQEPVFFTPISEGDSTNTVTVTGNSTWSSFTPNNIEVLVNSTSACKVLVIYSAKVDSISGLTSGNIYCGIAPRVQSTSGSSGTVVVSEEVSAGTSAHQMGAIDGTSWSHGSEAWAGLDTNSKYMGQYPALLGMRVINLSAGVNRYFHLRFYTSSSASAPVSATFSNPTIKVIPLTAI